MSFKEKKRQQRRHIKKEIQRIKDEYGSEAYFCGSSCSECDTLNHKESEHAELFDFKKNSQVDPEENKEEIKDSKIITTKMNQCKLNQDKPLKEEINSG